MSSLLLAALLLQAGPRPMAEQIRSDMRIYNNPDAPEGDRQLAFERLAEFGPGAILVVQREGDQLRDLGRRRPARHLGHQLKLRLLEKAEDSRGLEAMSRLSGISVKVELVKASPEAFLHQLRLLGVENLVVDPAEQERLSALRLTWSGDNRTAIEVLDEVLAPEGLDFVIRRGVVYVARRERIWPRIDAEPPPLDAARERELGALMERLDADRIEERDAAERDLLAFGLGARPALEKAAGAGEAEFRDRCRSLLRRLAAPPEGPSFAAVSGARAQALEGPDAAARASLEGRKIDVSSPRMTLEQLVELLSGIHKAPVAIGPDAGELAKRPLAFAYRGAGILDLVESLALPLGGDLRVEGGKLLVVSGGR